MADPEENDSSQKFVIDNLIQQMTAGITPQGQYSQFGFAKPPNTSWSDKENNCISHLYSYNQNSIIDVGGDSLSSGRAELLFPSCSYAQSSSSNLQDVLTNRKTEFSSVILPPSYGKTNNEAFSDSIDSSTNSAFDNMSYAKYQQVPTLNGHLKSRKESKPSYSDVVSKVVSNKTISPDLPKRSTSSPILPQKSSHFSNGTNKIKEKPFNSKSNPKGKRHSSSFLAERSESLKDSTFDSPRLNQRKFSNGHKINFDKRRRNSIDSVYCNSLENISLNDPTPKVRNNLDTLKQFETMKSEDSTEKPESKRLDTPLNNEQTSCSNNTKSAASKRPLNINNNLNTSKSTGRFSPSKSDNSVGSVLKSCNQDEWMSVNKNTKSETAVKSNETATKKSSESKSRHAKGSNSNHPNKVDKKQKETTFKRKKRRNDDAYSFLEIWFHTSSIYVSAWAKMALTFLAWLFHLVCDVVMMSSKLLLHIIVITLKNIEIFIKKLSLLISKYVKNKFSGIWNSEMDQKVVYGLTENIVLPATGEEAMKRLLACRGEDPYGILGVRSDCTDEDIKKFYKRQAILVHPDKNRQPGAEEAFKVLGHAFDLIGEADKRKLYDEKIVKDMQMSDAMQEFAEELKELRRKMEEAANTICCTKCNGKHKRQKVDRPTFSARYCKKCEIRHAAREGDLWAESSMLGFFWCYYLCMDGAVYDITQWAICQSDCLKHLQANTHVVQYRIVTGKNNSNNSRSNNRKQQHDIPSESDLEEFLNSLYQQSMSGARKGAEKTNKQSNSAKKKTKKKKN